jgi:hypothetical protein
MVMHLYTNYHWPILKDKNCMARTRKYYLKNNYLTLRSKVKVPWRSLRYVTHCLMVMHPHFKCNWPIWKDKKVMVRTSFAEEAEEVEEKIRLKQYVSLRSKGIHNKMLLNKPLTKDHFSCKVTFLCWSGGHIIGTTILSKLVFNCPLDTNSGKYSWLLINCKLETIANTSSNERTVSLL